MNENNSQEAEIEIPFRSNKRRKMIIIDEDDTKEEKQQDEKKNTEKEKKDCGICLEVVTIRGKMDGCDHSFCFPCIHQWSQVTNLCPLCKQEFKQLIKIDLNSISNSSPKKSDIIYVKKRKQRVPDEELPEGIIYYEFDGENVDEYEEDGFVLFSDEEEDGDLDADFYEEEEEIDAEFMKDMIDSSCSDSEDEIPVNIPQRRNSTARRGNISTRSSRNNNSSATRNNNSSATRNRNRRSNNSNNTINNTTNNNNININTNNNNNNNNNNGRNLNRKEMTEEAFNGVIDLITPPNSRGGFYVSTISSLNPGLIPPFPSFTNSINLISRDRISISSSSQSSSNGNNSNLINLISESPDSSFKKNNVNKVSNEVEESPLKISSTRARKFVYNDSSDDESKPSDKAWKDFDKILKQNEKENEKNRTTDSSPAWIRKKRNK